MDAHFTPLLDILAGMPTVHSLILKDSDAESLFRAMLDDTRIPPILPVLTDLTLELCRVQGESLVRWVKRRIPSSDPTLSVGTHPPPTTALSQVRFEDCAGISTKGWKQILEIVDSPKTLNTV